MTWTEAAAAVITLISVYLSARQNIWSWPTAIVGVGIYVVVFWHSKLYADMGLQFVYIALSIYGCYEWLHGGENRSELHVSSGWRRSYPIALAITIAFALGLGTFLKKATDAALPYADSSLTSFSLLAQWMMTRKYIENWFLWIAVDIFYIAMFTFKHLYLTALLYAVFIGVCWFAYVEWRRDLTRAAATPQDSVALRASTGQSSPETTR
jgi:nicotinamide mononucleotide transporter